MNEKFDLIFMKEALKEAEKGYKCDEVPVGSVLVFNNKVIGRGYNQVETLKDPTAHAEMICITAGAGYFNDWRLVDTVLYCTLEPCPMCAGAILNSRIKRVVWGACDLRVGANGSFIDLFGIKHPFHSVEIVGRCLEQESKELLQRFFKEKRIQKSLNDSWI